MISFYFLGFCKKIGLTFDLIKNIIITLAYYQTFDMYQESSSDNPYFHCIKCPTYFNRNV